MVLTSTEKVPVTAAPGRVTATVPVRPPTTPVALICSWPLALVTEASGGPRLETLPLPSDSEIEALAMPTVRTPAESVRVRSPVIDWP